MPQRLETIFHPSNTTLDRLVGKSRSYGSPTEIRTVKKKIKDVGVPILENLAITAARVRKLSYSPYSLYAVGASVRDHQGNITIGVNIEKAPYTTTTHAESLAIDMAIVQESIIRNGRNFISEVAVSHDGKSPPCGICLTVIKEFGDNDPLIIIAKPNGEIRRVTSLSLSLPNAFGPKDLGIK